MPSINLEELMGHLGKPLNSPEIQNYIKTNGGTTPFFRDDEGDVDDKCFSHFFELGLELIFERVNAESLATLRTIQIYLTQTSTHKPFTGTLPYALTAGELQASIRKRLGEPKVHNSMFNIDMWSYENLEVVTSYDEANCTLTDVQITLP